MFKGSEEHKEYMREYNRKHREQKRLWMWNQRHNEENAGTRRGNAAYQKLVLEDKRFLKGAPFCDTCKQRHWPLQMDRDIDLGVLPEDYLLQQA